MKIVILGSSVGGSESRQYVSTYLVNDVIAVDAGCLAFYGSPQDQERVRHVLLTHAHSDHTASLPMFLENVWTPLPDCPCVYGSEETLAALRRFIFNDDVWPDFVALSETMPPFLRLQTLQPEVPIKIEGLVVTPVCVDHTVPTFGYVLQEGGAAVILAGDSGPTARLWEVAQTTPGLRAVFLEASFPNRMGDIAEASRHLTPNMFRCEVGKVPAGVKIIAVHLKVRYREEIVRELLDLSLARVEIGECDREYRF
jgi:ribonuclease BN (tRNA processing enzyme)